MQFTDIFIRRPVLATVISLLILVLGLRALFSIPVLQFPRTENAVVTVTTVYYGADADVVAGFITTPLENAIAQANGIDYMTSNSTSGTSTITVNLRLNSDYHSALTEISTKISSVLNQLPPGSQQPILSVQVGQTIAAMYIGFNSDVLPQNGITDYLVRVVQPRLQSVNGVQTARLLGGQNYALRAWLDPQKMAAFGVTASDVSAALAANDYISGLGNTKGQMVQVNLTASTGLHTLEEFRRLVVYQKNNAIVRLEDVANVTLGADDYESRVGFDGKKAVYIAIEIAPSANLLEVIGNVRKVMPEIQAQLPEGVHGEIVYDSTAFVNSSINEVIHTLIEALLIVTLVVFAFLGSPRAVAIPVIAIPLSLIGAFVFMLMFGFSINLLTLLALVLGIGLVVDDAIIVVENVSRHLDEGLSKTEAAIKAARELGGPIIAMTAVLVAVYVPIGFQGGLTGALFTEFAFTLVGAITISGIVALTLSPMMCAKLLKPHNEDKESPFLEKILAKVRYYNSFFYNPERPLRSYALLLLPMAALYASLALASHLTGLPLLLLNIAQCLLLLHFGFFCVGSFMGDTSYHFVAHGLSRIWAKYASHPVLLIAFPLLMLVAGIAASMALPENTWLGKALMAPAILLLPLILYVLLTLPVLVFTAAIHFLREENYIKLLRGSLNYRPVTYVFAGIILCSIYFLYSIATTELAPQEDQGVVIAFATGAPNSTLQQRQIFAKEVFSTLNGYPETAHVFQIDAPGNSVAGAVLKPWDQRTRTSNDMMRPMQQDLAKIAGLNTVAFQPPPLPGARGLPIQFVIKTTQSFTELQQVTQEFMTKAMQSGNFIFLDTDLKIDLPQATVDIDRDKTAQLGLNMNDVGSSLAAMLGGGYVNYFSLAQRSYKVIPQVMQNERLNIDQLNNYYIRAASGTMIPLSTIAKIEQKTVPETLNHFQQMNAAVVQGVMFPGRALGDVLGYMKKLSEETLPQGYNIDFGGQSRQFAQESSGFVGTFLFALIIIFLTLAALFESFRDPLIILISVPMSIAGALIFISIGVGGASINIYTQVGLVTLMGLISKHGILITEFANAAQKAGKSKLEAIIEASVTRLRPILMTTAAMVLGVLPLITASGAGALSRFNMGLVIASGLAIGTLFTLFVVPAVYMLLAADHHAHKETEAAGMPTQPQPVSVP